MPAPLAAEMTTRRDLVLTVGSMSKSFWGGLRVGWIRAERATIATIAALRPSIDMGTPVLEQFAAARLLGTSRRDTAGAPRDPAGPPGAAAVAAEPPPARLAARPGHRRHVAVGAAARTDEHRAVGGRVAAGPRPARRPALRRRRHAGAVRPGALRAARRPAHRGRGTARPRLAQHHRVRRRRSRRPSWSSSRVARRSRATSVGDVDAAHHAVAARRRPRSRRG